MPTWAEQAALLAPVDLRLSARHHLEPAVQPVQRVVVANLRIVGDPRPRFGQEQFDPLVAAGEAVFGDQPFMDHRALQRDISPQPRLHHRDERGDQRRLR